MSIMIKGAEMPKGCAECPCILEEWMCGAKGLYVHNELINPFKERPNWCPLAEVVRCRDCKWWRDDSRMIDLPKDKLIAPCNINERDSYEDDYCSYGERKDGEE